MTAIGCLLIILNGCNWGESRPAARAVSFIVADDTNWWDADIRLFLKNG